MKHPYLPRTSPLSNALFGQGKRSKAAVGILAAALASTIAPAALQAQVSQAWIDTNLNNDWSTSALNWDAGAGWVNGNHATFGGTGETVELEGAITVGDITFDSNGYVIADEDNDGSLTLSGPSTITVTTAGDRATISDAIVGGALTKAGAGILVLSGANTYAGDTIVNLGQLRVAHNSALGTAAGGTVVNAGAELVLENGVTISGETITISGSGVAHTGALSTAGSATWAGNVVLTASTVVPRLGASANNTLEITGLISGGGTNGLEITGQGGSGTVKISSTGNTYSGPTQIIRGILQIGATNALPTGTVLNVDSSTAQESAYFDLNGFDQTVAGLTRGNSVGDGHAFIMNSGQNDSTLTVNTPSATTTHTYSGSFVDIEGAGKLTISKTGQGTLILSGDNSDFSGDIMVSGTNSNLSITNAQALGNSTGVTSARSGGRVTLANGLTITGETLHLAGNGGNYGALQAAGNAAATWAGPIVLEDGDARVGASSGGVLTLTGDIRNGAGNNLVISATGSTLGQVVVSGTNNTYTGNTNIIRGILKIGAHNALPTSTTLNVDAVNVDTVTESAIFDLNGYNQTVGGLASLGADAGTNLAAILNNGSTPSTFTLNQASGTSTYTGFFQDGTGQLAVTKAGGGTLVLTKKHTYTGPTTLLGGTIELRNADGALASSSINVQGGSWLVLDNVATVNNNDRLKDTANVTLNRGNFSLRGSNTSASSETVGSMTLGPGQSQIKVTHGTDQNATLTTQLVRNAGGGTALVYGIDLGKDGTSSTGVGRVLFSNAPTLIGTTDALASGRNTTAQNTKIVPYLLGSVNPTTGLGSDIGTPNTFVTYHESGGVRPLDINTEFATDQQVEGANTRLLTAKTFNAGTVNSLILSITGSSNSLGLTGELTVASGAILFTNSSNITGGTLQFGQNEAIISANIGATGTIGSKLSGQGGLTLNGPGTIGLGNGTSDYTGGTTVLGGAVIVPQANSNGAGATLTSGPFGKGDLIFVDGGIRSAQGSAYTVGNSVKLRGDLSLVSGGNHLNLTGPVTIEGSNRTITNSSASNTTFGGDIGDGGSGYGLTFNGTGTGNVVLTGNNTYEGPTKLQSGNLVVSGSIAGETFVGNSAAPNDAAILRGSGSLKNVAALTAGATVAPGNSLDVAGVLKTGAFSLSNGAHLELQIGGITAGGESTTGHDQLIAAGQVSLTGGDLKLSLLGMPAFNSSTTLFLVVNNSGLAINGAFSTLNGSAFDPTNIVLGGQQFALVYNANFAGTGSDNIANDLALVAVPEPTSAAMLLMGLGTLGFSRLGRRLRRTER